VREGSINPAATKPLKPSIATPMAKAHMRMRLQSPMWMMSPTAPMVQKWVCCAMAPNTIERANVAHNT